jgi:predicted DNA-binding antitoxin AbrB/MazE fold protein
MPIFDDLSRDKGALPMKTITAIFENGVLKPTQPLDLPDHAQVRLTVEQLDLDEQTRRNQETLAALEFLWKNVSICSKEPHLTRDQLHERR